MIKIEDITLKMFKKFHIICFALIWIYILSYPFINKIFDLKSDYKTNYEITYEVIWVSAIPILNTAALITMIKEDIDLYKQNHRKKL